MIKESAEAHNALAGTVVNFSRVFFGAAAVIHLQADVNSATVKTGRGDLVLCLKHDLC